MEENGISKNSNEPVNVRIVSEKATLGTPKRRTKSKSQFDKVLEKARNIFDAQLDRSVKTKRASIERALIRVGKNSYTHEQFLADLNRRMFRLIDSKKFEADCKAHSLETLNAASHIAFDGLSHVYDVLDNGIEASYASRLLEMREAIFSEKDFESVKLEKTPDVSEPVEQ